MALNKLDIIHNYMNKNGWGLRKDAAQLFNQLSAIIDDVIIYHSTFYPWRFRRSSETLTILSISIGAENLSSIEGCSVTNVGDLQKISKDEYERIIKNNTSTTSAPNSVFIDGVTVYPCPLPASGLEITAWGLLKVDTPTAALSIISTNHEPLLQMLIDQRLGKSGLEVYVDAAGRYFAEECIGRVEKLREDDYWFNIRASIGE